MARKPASVSCQRASGRKAPRKRRAAAPNAAPGCCMRMRSVSNGWPASTPSAPPTAPGDVKRRCQCSSIRIHDVHTVRHTCARLLCRSAEVHTTCFRGCHGRACMRKRAARGDSAGESLPRDPHTVCAQLRNLVVCASGRCARQQLRSGARGAARATMAAQQASQRQPFSRNTMALGPPKKQQLPKYPPELDTKARARRVACVGGAMPPPAALRTRRVPWRATLGLLPLCAVPPLTRRVAHDRSTCAR